MNADLTETISELADEDAHAALPGEPGARTDRRRREPPAPGLGRCPWPSAASSRSPCNPTLS